MGDTTGVERFFPYEAPYENQRAAMDAVRDALASGTDVLFEGACGTGKTLAALAPALDCADETGKTVVITTSVHQQMRQFVAEARAIRAAQPLRAVVFRGKASMCHLDVGYQECQVLRENTRELREAESEAADLEARAEELLAAAREGEEGATEARAAVMDELETVRGAIEDLADAATCEHYRANLSGSNDEFYGWLYDGVRTPEEIYEHADRQGLCGYELLKEGVEGVDLVVCNYHHLLDPGIREQFLRWLGREPGDVIAVFDEAHNLPDAAREHATRTLTERTLESACEELADADHPRADRAANVLGAFRDALAAVRGDARVGEVDENWTDVAVENDDRRDDLTLQFLRRYEGRGIEGDLEAARLVADDLEETYEAAYRRGETDVRQECAVTPAADFVATYLDAGETPGEYPVVALRRDEGTGEVYARAEVYATVPRDVTGGLFGDLHASVLMSATLRPFDVFADSVGLTDPEELAYGLTFPPENRRTFAVDVPPLFSSDREDPAVQRAVTGALADVIGYTPGNVLCFFPSYAEAERYHDRLAGETTCLLDEPGVRAEELRRRFVDHDDAALFTSLWGTLAEGVSFDGDDARGVAVVGVPYPYLDARTEAVQDAYDDAFEGTDAGWRYAVEIPTVRKTRQALGRVLRSPEDVAVRALIDRRYTAAGEADLGEYSVRGSFPSEEREELVDVDPGKLKFALLNFFGEHGPWAEWPDGPPAP